MFEDDFYFEFQHQRAQYRSDSRYTTCRVYQKAPFAAFLRGIKNTPRGSVDREIFMRNRPAPIVQTFAVCNLAKDNFSKKIGRIKARGRATAELLKLGHKPTF